MPTIIFPKPRKSAQYSKTSNKNGSIEAKGSDAAFLWAQTITWIALSNNSPFDCMHLTFRMNPSLPSYPNTVPNGSPIRKSRSRLFSVLLPWELPCILREQNQRGSYRHPAPPPSHCSPLEISLTRAKSPLHPAPSRAGQAKDSCRHPAISVIPFRQSSWACGHEPGAQHHQLAR